MRVVSICLANEVSVAAPCLINVSPPSLISMSPYCPLRSLDVIAPICNSHQGAKIRTYYYKSKIGSKIWHCQKKEVSLHLS